MCLPLVNQHTKNGKLGFSLARTAIGCAPPLVDKRQRAGLLRRGKGAISCCETGAFYHASYLFHSEDCQAHCKGYYKDHENIPRKREGFVMPADDIFLGKWIAVLHRYCKSYVNRKLAA